MDVTGEYRGREKGTGDIWRVEEGRRDDREEPDEGGRERNEREGRREG